MTNVATGTATEHLSFCDAPRPGEDAEHVCMSRLLTLEHIGGETGSEWAEMYAGVMREPHASPVVYLNGFTDPHGAEQELQVRPSQARSLAAALVRLADLVEHGE